MLLLLYEPKSYVVGGFFGDQDSWNKVEKRWKRKNDLEGVPRYHAAHLNGSWWEYDGWSTSRRVRYSKEMLKILKNRGRKLHGISCGMHVDEYRTIISPSGQEKMGPPYLVCFKSVIAAVAEQMDYGGFRPEDQFATVIDRNDYDIEATRIFYEMKDNPAFAYRHRLATCTPGSAEEFIGLQPADFVAYETFRLMHDKRNGTTKIRAALNTMFGTTGFLGYLFGEESLSRIKDAVDATDCKPNGFVVIPPYIED